ncbi:hypothetical protein CcCBS67573_g07624 [Chytriomyces confervae]|uniref:GATA-type domain-containing protein n=1 Tax=Chytriomyces confervae TaxID=246404 RepID=A0A507ET33_9FUNG|nr:hypothetical protein CcCBS67573_g07624 [Chytriomyces confervae]
MGCVQSETMVQTQRSRQIDRMIQKQLEDEEKQQTVKLLLLGAGEVGKSTVLKQMRLIYNVQFTPEEITSFKVTMRNNLLDCTQSLIEAMYLLKIPFGFIPPTREAEGHLSELDPIPQHSNPELGVTPTHVNDESLRESAVTAVSNGKLKSLSAQKLEASGGGGGSRRESTVVSGHSPQAHKKDDPIAKLAEIEYDKAGGEDGQECAVADAARDILSVEISDDFGSTEMTGSTEKAIRLIWNDSGIQYCFSRSAEFQLMDSCKYLMDNLERICDLKFIPTETDILNARIMTVTVTETKFFIEKTLYRVFDVGGQRSERKKWASYFEDVTAVIYLCAISSYDQTCGEDETVNRMTESLTLFTAICNHPLFKTTGMIVFLNKIDIFKEKLNSILISDYFPEFTGENSYENGYTYFIKQFKKVNKYPDRKIYFHLTWATDTHQIRTIFDTVHDVIIRLNLKEIDFALRISKTELSNIERPRESAAATSNSPAALQVLTIYLRVYNLGIGFSLPQKKEESSHESAAGADVASAKREDGPVVLVPIKLDFDVDTHGFRLKDQFCWNLNETLVSPLLYAQQLVSDFRLPPAAVEEISKAIKDQTEEFYDHTYIRPPIGSQGLEPPLVPLPPIQSLSNRKQLSSETPAVHLDDHPNLRVSLKIDVSIGTITVMDNVEWDLNCSRNSPEDFALVMCCELGLTPEFRVAIAHQLRDQIHMYHKTLFALEHPFDDSQIDDEDLWFNHFLPPVETAERKPENRAFYTPTLLTGAMPSQAPTSLDDKPNATTARRRRAGATNRARGRTALPEREVTRLWMSALPIWRNGVKRGTMPRGVPAQMQATATTGLLPRRRTRQDTALEVMEEETDALMGGVTLIESLGMKRQEKWKAWACQNCRATITKTELIRRGPEGASTLCEACGLHFSKTGEMRSHASASEPETITKNWYQYPKIVDAHRDD